MKPSKIKIKKLQLSWNDRVIVPSEILSEKFGLPGVRVQFFFALYQQLGDVVMGPCR